MRRTSRLLVLFGIGLAVLTFVLIVALLPTTKDNGKSGGPTASPPVNVTVVEALVDIQLGTVVTKDMLTTATIPVAAARRDAYHDPSQAIGQTARRAVLTGAQVGDADFALDQNSATVPVPPGKRALAVQVDELTGVGKLLYPGDTVDLLITFDEATIKVLTIQPGTTTAQHDDNFRPLTVKAPLLLQDIQVLSTIDSQEDQRGTTPAAGASPAPSSGPTLTGAKKLIILAVTDAQAEAILFARYGGTIDLVLRNAGDAGQTANTDGVILKTMFDKYGVIPPYLLRTFPIFVPQQP